MKRLIIFASILLISIGMKAQTIQGKVINTNNDAVDFATIVLQTTDSVYIESAYTDSLGQFSFQSNLNTYRLIIQHLMYETYESEFTTLDTGTIQLTIKNQTLNELVVKGERPLVRVIDGRITYDMPLLLEGKVVSNAYESLLQLPGVREQDGSLILAGANSLSIIINGKPSTMTTEQLFELLKNIPKERILHAEIMYSAPPQYHVRGAAINLILEQAMSESPTLQGQINSAYSQRYYDNYKAGISLLYTTPRSTTDFLYSYNDLGHRNGHDLYSKHLYNGQIYDIEQHNGGNSLAHIHNIRIGNDFQLNDKNKLSLAYTTQIKPDQQASEHSFGSFSNSSNTNSVNKPTQMHNIAAGYNSGFGLNIGIDYTSFDNYSTQHYTEAMQGKEDTFDAQTKQSINRLSIYADQTHNLSSGWRLNYGTKFMQASGKSSQTYQSLTGTDLSGSNSFSDQQEYTYNLYSGFNKSFSEKLSLAIALTGEYYKYENFKEWSVFPTLEATYISSPTHIFQLAMSSDKEYPNYWELTNSIGYLNGYMEVHGNPALRPHKNYLVNFNYILKSKYVFTAYINYMDDYFVQLPYQSPDKLTLIYKTTNFDYRQQMGINASIPFNIGAILDTRFTTSGFYDKNKSSNFHETSFRNDNLGVFAQLNNTINLSSQPNIKMEIAASYISKNIQGPSEITPMYRLDTGIKWIFANDKAELRLKADDVFNTWSPKEWRMNTKTQNLQMHIHPDSRNISLSFTYKFGGYKEKQHKEVDTSRFK